MDINEIPKLKEIAANQIDLAKRYAQARETAGKAKTEMEILLTAALPNIRLSKPNVGVDMAFLMMMELSPDTKEIYRQWKEAEAEYKGLEKLLEANGSYIMFYQSIMRWEKEGEKWGA